MVPYELLERVVAIFERLGVSYLVTGSIAAMAYGEPRLTNDIDIIAEVTEKQIPLLLTRAGFSECGASILRLPTRRISLPRRM